MAAAAFGSRDRKKATAGLKRTSRSGVAGARKKKNNQAKRRTQDQAATFQRLQLLKDSGKKLTKAQEKALAKHEGAFLASHGLDKAAARRMALEHTKREKIAARILGPSGLAHAVKISRADGRPFDQADLNVFIDSGWGIEAAGSVAGRVGLGGLPGVVMGADDFRFNPEPLGPSGMARALIITGRIDEPTLWELVAGGYDVSRAPQKLREGIHRNPDPSTEKKVYAHLVKEAKRGHALNEEELCQVLKLAPGALLAALQNLVNKGLAHEAGRDLFGTCWAPGTPSRGLFENPTPGRKAEKKAAAWFQRENLTTGARTIRLPDTVEAVEIGRIVAIEYESDKYDGKKRIWRHEVTQKRDLHVSTDGKVLVVLPGFKITKRGIEG